MSLKLSVKSQYAVRALFELAKRNGQGPVNVRELAMAQAIPPKFLEVILGQLKHGGFVRSHRGHEGGYEVAIHPDRLTVGKVIRYLEGSLAPVDCSGHGSKDECPLLDNCVLKGMWDKARDAIEAVYDGTTFGDLVAEDYRQNKSEALNFSI